MMARIRIVEVEGDADELARLDIEKLLREYSAPKLGSGRGEGIEPEVGGAPEELRQYINAKASRQEADLFLRFLTTVLKWNAVVWRFGAHGRDGDPRYVLLHRLPQHKGAFVYVRPRQGQLLFRLRSDAIEASPLVTVRKGRVYQVDVALTSEAALEKALELTQRAYDGAVLDT